MTRQLENSKYFTTKFANWLRQNEALDSKKGFTCSDIDFIWTNYKTGKFMMLEEKCLNSKIGFAQDKILNRVHECLKTDKNYMGFYFIQFSNESPEDGLIFLTNMDTRIKKQVTIEELTFFLEKFRLPTDQFELDFFANF